MKSFIKGESIVGRYSDEYSEGRVTATVVRKNRKTIVLKLETIKEPITFRLITEDGNETAYWAGMVFRAGTKPTITFSWT